MSSSYSGPDLFELSSFYKQSIGLNKIINYNINKSVMKQSIAQPKQSPRGDEEISAIRYMNMDVDRLTFETQMRQMMRELIEPIIVKTKNDREMIYKLQKNEEDFFERIDFLEKSVFKKDPETGATLFDQIEEKILEMQIQIKAHMQAFKEQVQMTEQKCDNEVFKQNQRILKIENYDKMIDNNKKAIEMVQFQIENTVIQIRSEVEMQKESQMVEMRLLQDKIHQLTSMCDNLPPQVKICESKVKSVENQGHLLESKVNQIIMENLSIIQTKWGVHDQEKFQEKLSMHLMEIEKLVDKNGDHCDSLQNWIDIYMPMRLQHQITETMKECLPRKGKYMLGVVDLQMQQQLRERMFADVNHPNLKKRCLDVITQLKLDADTLITENMRVVNAANENWTVLEMQEKKKEMEEKKKQKLEDTVLPRTERQGGGGDADSEALGRLQEQLEQFCLDECGKVEQKYKDDLKKFQHTTLVQLEGLDASINLLNNQNSAFINALKDEVEQSASAQRKQNMDTLGLIKGLSATIKKMRDQQNVQQEDSKQLRLTMSLAVQQQKYISSFINLKMGESGLNTMEQSSAHLNIIEQSSSQGIQKQLTLFKKQNSTVGHLRMDDEALVTKNVNKILHDANENMKKLNISMFRTNFKKEKGKLPDNIQAFDVEKKLEKHGTNDSLKTSFIEEVDEKDSMSSINDKAIKKTSIDLLQHKLSGRSNAPSTSYGIDASPLFRHIEEPGVFVNEESKSNEIDDATSLNDLNRKLNTRLNAPSNNLSPVATKKDKKFLLSKKQIHTFRQNAQTTMQTYNRLSIPTNGGKSNEKGTNITQSFDFSALDGNQRYMKRGSMPNGVPPILAQVQKPPITGWKISTGNSAKNGNNIMNMSGSSSTGMNQSFGFGPLKEKRAKYSSQEKIPNQYLNADFSFDKLGAPDPNLLPKIL